MNFRQEKRIFYNWMKKRGILENYKRNREDPLIGRSRIIRKADRLVINPFYWMPSPEGFKFWLHIDMKWRKHLNRKRRKYNK